jgi:hypothetical protein
MVLTIDKPVVWRERRVRGGQVLEPLEMWRASVGALAKHEAAPGEELEDVVPGLKDLALNRLAAADDVAHARRPRSECGLR